MRTEAVVWLLAALLGGCAAGPASGTAGKTAGEQRSRQTGGRCSSALKAALARLDSDVESFDGVAAEAWPDLALQGCHAEAARLIDAYLERPPDLSGTERARLSFQSGQMHAYAGDRQTAMARFEASRLDREPPESLGRWNAYVDATLAFLRGDRTTLERQRQIIAAGPEVDGEVPHLRVVDALIEHFGTSYRVAYDSVRPRLRKRRR